MNLFTYQFKKKYVQIYYIGIVYYYVQCIEKSTTFITSIFSENLVMQFFFKFIQKMYNPYIMYTHFL